MTLAIEAAKKVKILYSTDKNLLSTVRSFLNPLIGDGKLQINIAYFEFLIYQTSLRESQFQNHQLFQH